MKTNNGRNLVFEDLERAVQRFSEVPLDAKACSLEMDGSIQRFEFVVELTWKAFKEFLAYYGIIANSPKDAIQHAYKKKWILDEKQWLQMMKDRNLTSHVYREDIAQEVYDRLGAYIPLFKAALETLRSEKEKE